MLKQIVIIAAGIIAAAIILFVLLSILVSAPDSVGNPVPTVNPITQMPCITATVIGNSDPSYAPGYKTPGSTETIGCNGY